MGWRDHIDVHPAADLFPLMSPDELRVLSEDIKEHGLRMLPVTLLKKNGKRQYLDGRNRLDALDLAGLPLPTQYDDIEEGKGFDPDAYVVSVNMHRRHLDADAKQEVIRKLRAKGMSIRAIAEITDTPKSTVADGLAKDQLSGIRTAEAEPEPAGPPPEVEAEAEAEPGAPPAAPPPAPAATLPAENVTGADGAKAPLAPRTTGKDGKSYPAKGKGSSKAPAAPKAPAAAARDLAVNAFDAALKKRPADTIDEFAKLLLNRRKEITALPEPRRFELVMAMAETLGFGAGDLRRLLEANEAVAA
jgi:DNA-binding transcriptional MerR regulator